MAHWALDQLNPAMRKQAEEQIALNGKARKVELLEPEPYARKSDMKTKEKSPRGGNKYKNVRVTTEEASFPSQKEYRRWLDLKMLVAAGAIKELQLQVLFELAPSYVRNGRKFPALRYFADFVYLERVGAEWVKIVEDVKGFTNTIYRMKRHLMATVHGVTIRET